MTNKDTRPGNALADLGKRFKLHELQADQRVRCERISSEAARLAGLIEETVPRMTRELSLAITKLEEAVLWAHAGIARNPELLDEGDPNAS